MSSKIKIEPRGSYFQTDEDGFLVNPASMQKVQEKWKPLIRDTVELYQLTYDEKLKNVYLRGSVAKGEAVDGVSDIDTFAYVDMSKSELKDVHVDRDRLKDLEAKYHFVEGIEVSVLPVAEIPDNYIILNQSLCVYGEPVEVPRMKPGKAMAIHAPKFHTRMQWFREVLERDESEDARKRWCVWFMKGLLRVGFELTMERSQKYTRDLYLCYDTFAEYYPEKEPEMREVLDLALNPTADNAKMRRVMEGLGMWLMAEIPNQFEHSTTH